MHFFPSPVSKNIGVPGTIPQDVRRSDVLAPGSVCRAALPSNGGESDSYRSLLSHLGNDEDDDQGQLDDNDT